MKQIGRFSAICLIVVTAPAISADRADLLVSDFEGDDYGTWKVEGTAFGTRPAGGALSGQMPVGGFLGKGLVNSFHGGDDSKGKLTSATFVIERTHISFLIGGGWKQFAAAAANAASVPPPSAISSTNSFLPSSA
jgi:fructan beta-fructosidase